MADLSKLHVLIMAGGSGTRFWPKSRAKKPKQLLALVDDKTLIEHTVQRFAKAVPLSQIWIVTTQILTEPTKITLGNKYKEVRFLAEPEGKNTASCILWGVKEIEKTDSNAMVAVMAADHHIEDESAFLNALEIAVLEAEKIDAILTIGIQPDRPETGYGYIEVEKRVESGVNDVKRFVEKPDIRTAVRYVESQKYYWNAGMFIFSVKTALHAFRSCMPELEKLFQAGGDIKKIYASINGELAQSFDYGVMEHALEKSIPVKVVVAQCGWNDLGSFTALEDINKSVRGDVITHDSGSNIVQSDAGIIALLGVSDLIVVRDGNITLVASKDRAQDIKKLLEKVKQSHPEEL